MWWQESDLPRGSSPHEVPHFPRTLSVTLVHHGASPWPESTSAQYHLRQWAEGALCFHQAKLCPIGDPARCTKLSSKWHLFSVTRNKSNLNHFCPCILVLMSPKKRQCSDMLDGMSFCHREETQQGQLQQGGQSSQPAGCTQKPPQDHWPACTPQCHIRNTPSSAGTGTAVAWQEPQDTHT